MTVEARARRAAAALVASVEPLAADPPPLRPAHPVRRVVLAAAVVLLVVAAVALVRSGDEAAAPVSTGPAAVPRLVPDAVPAGGRLALVDLPDAAAGTGSVVEAALYGRPGPGGPTAGGDLGVVVAPSEPFALRSGATELVDLGGRKATLSANAPGGSEGWSLTWAEGDRYVGLATHTLAPEELIAAAGDVRLVDGVPELGSPPDGFRLVAAPRPVVGAPDTLLPAGAEGHGVLVSFEALQWRVSVLTVAGGEDDELLARWLHGPGRAVTVRGRAAELATDRNLTKLVWREAPGVLVVVQAVDAPEEELLALLGSLRPATDAEWEDLQSDPEEVEDEPEVVASASFDTARGEATVTLDSEAGICVQIAGRSGRWCGPIAEDGGLRASMAPRPDGAWIVYGQAPPSATRVEIEHAGGSLPVNHLDGGLFAVALPGSLRPERVTAYEEPSLVLGSVVPQPP